MGDGETGNGRKCKKSVWLSESWGKEPKEGVVKQKKLQLGERRLLRRRCWQLAMKRQKDVWRHTERTERLKDVYIRAKGK